NTLHRLVGHRDAVRCGQFSRGGKEFASGGEDGTLRFWDVAGGAPTGRSLSFGPDGVTSVRFTPDTQVVVRLRNWLVVGDPEPGPRRLELPTERATVVGVSPDSKRLVRSLSNGAVEVRRLQDAAEEFLLCGHAQPVRSVAFHPDGSRLASGGNDNTIYIWPLARVPEVASVALPGMTGRPRVSDISGLAYSPDGKTLAVAAAHHQPQAGGSESVFLIDPGTGQERRRRKGANRVAFHPEGKFLAVGSAEVDIALYETSTWKIVHVLRGPEGTCGAVGFSADGSRLVTGGTDRTIHVWDVASGEQLPSLA